MLARYDYMLRNHTLKTKICTSFTVGCTADFICQNLQLGSYQDSVRQVRQGLIGCCLQMPVLHCFLKYLVPVLVVPSSFAATVVLRIVGHITLVTPWMQTSFLFTVGAH